MAIVAEGLGRVASGITVDRQNRAELARHIKHATLSRRAEVRSILENMKDARAKSSRDMAANMRKAAMSRRSEVRSMMNRLRQSRAKETREYHEKATAFMRDLTNGVAGMLAKFAKEDHERAAILHRSFVAYGRDRMEARAVWQGKPIGRQAAASSSQVSSPMTSQAAEAKPEVHSSHEAQATHSPEATSGRHPFAASSHRDPSQRSGKGSK